MLKTKDSPVTRQIHQIRRVSGPLAGKAAGTLSNIEIRFRPDSKRKNFMGKMKFIAPAVAIGMILGRLTSKPPTD